MHEPLTQQPGQMTIQDYVTVLMRRRRTLMRTFISVVIVGLILTILTHPTYRATTLLMLQNNRSMLGGGGAMDLPFFKDLVPQTGHDIDTQLEVLLSSHVLNEAANHAGVPSSQVKLTAAQQEDTDVIELNVDARKPEYAQKMALIIPDALRDYLLTMRKAGISNALDWVKQHHDDEQKKLQVAEQALQKFKQNRKIVDVSEERNVRLMQIMQMRDKLRNVEADLAGSQAQLDNLIKKRQATPDLIETPTIITNQQAKQDKEDQISALQVQRQSLLQLWKPNDYRVRQVDAQISDLHKQIAALPATVKINVTTQNPQAIAYDNQISSTQGEVASIIAGVANLNASIAAGSNEMNKFNALELQQSELQREVDRHSISEAQLARTVDDLSIRQHANDNPVEVMSAPGPAKKISPIIWRNAIFIVLLAIIAAICAAMLQEQIDDRIYTPSDATVSLEAPPLGFVPLVAKSESLMLFDRGRSNSLLETYRLLRSNVQFAAVDEPIRSLLITSSVPGEGKTVTAVNLGAATALSGRRVIIVDADLRRPTLHDKFGLTRQPGLTSVLIGHTSLEEALQTTPIPGLQLLSCGPIPPNPAELLSSRAMHDMHRQLMQMADLVIFDSPPVLATADAQVLAAQVDGVVYVVQLGETRKSAVRFAADLLRQARARTLGVVFNKMSVSAKPGYYGYGYYGYGYGYYYYGTYHYHSKYGAEVSDEKQEARRELAAEFEALPHRNDTRTPENAEPTNNPERRNKSDEV
jgi:capsular exopolysaccharide synthesis family protein